MFVLNRTTQKLYYDDPSLTECTARVVKVDLHHVELDATVAYPEGGGQDADQGVIIIPDGREIRFVHVRKMYGNRALLADFPDIQVDGIIEHVVHDDDLPLLACLAAGMPVVVRINRLRRAQLSLSHTAAHLLYLGVAAVRPGAIAAIFGCHIRTDAARLDFSVTDRFTIDDVGQIERVANELVTRDSVVRVYPHEKFRDARYWECEGNVMPCGGTHISSTGRIGVVRISRKSLGKGKERLSVTFDNATFDPGEALGPGSFGDSP
jgi:Ser-tRNA(Ala) deacylase AlaX